MENHSTAHREILQEHVTSINTGCVVRCVPAQDAVVVQCSRRRGSGAVFPAPAPCRSPGYFMGAVSGCGRRQLASAPAICHSRRRQPSPAPPATDAASGKRRFGSVVRRACTRAFRTCVQNRFDHVLHMTVAKTLASPMSPT